MARERFRLDGKRAMITGGNRGLGLAMAKGLAQQGANLALVARTAEQLDDAAKIITQTCKVDICKYAFDLSATDQIADFFQNAVEQAGPIDILINCAGINLRGPAEEIELETWEKVLRLNLTAPFLLSQAFCRHHKETQKPGRIINICSLLSASGRPTTCPYGAAKTGLLGLTRNLAVEWAPYHINVNAIGPGYLRTEMTEPLYQDEKFNEWITQRTPMQRWGDPDELVGAVILLVSDAGQFITGQILYVDGGIQAAL
jgi:gluconate 5-dehydrogenase